MFDYRFGLLQIVVFILIASGAINTSLMGQDETGFYIYSEEISSEDLAAVLNFIQEDQELLFELIEDLNDFLAIPIAVPIIFMDCGVANAFYAARAANSRNVLRNVVRVLQDIQSV